MTTTRTTRRKVWPQSQIQIIRHAKDLAKAAGAILNVAQQKAYNRGVSDFENGTRDHPPYGFTDLKAAWRMGWLKASQKARR